MTLTAALLVAAATTVTRAAGVIVVDNALINVETVQVAGKVAACGIRIKAPHRLADQSVRTWDFTLYLAQPDKSLELAVNASSYDVSTAGAAPVMRPAPTELAFTVSGNPKVYTATHIRPSQPDGASLGSLAGQGAGQVMTALKVGTPVVMFFRPRDSDTEAVIVSGAQNTQNDDSFGHCIQAMSQAAIPR